MMGWIASVLLGNSLARLVLAVVLTAGATWVVKGIMEEIECANEAEVAALRAELENTREIAMRNQRIAAALRARAESLQRESMERDQLIRDLRQRFEQSPDCAFTDEELEQLHKLGGTGQ